MNLGDIVFLVVLEIVCGVATYGIYKGMFGSCPICSKEPFPWWPCEAWVILASALGPFSLFGVLMVSPEHSHEHKSPAHLCWRLRMPRTETNND